MTEGYLLSGQRSELSGSCCRRGSREPMGACPAACAVGVDPSPVALKSARRRNAPHRQRPPDPGHRRYRAGARPPARWPRPGLPRPVLLGRPGARPAAGTRDLGAGRPHRPGLPAPPAHAAGRPAHLPREGFTLYDSDDHVGAVPRQAGFTPPEVRIIGDPGHLGGRLALATPTPGHQAIPRGRAADRRQNSHS